MNKLDKESDACIKMYNEAHEAYIEAIKATNEAYEAFIEARKRERAAYTFWSTFRF